MPLRFFLNVDNFRLTSFFVACRRFLRVFFLFSRRSFIFREFLLTLTKSATPKATNAQKLTQMITSWWIEKSIPLPLFWSIRAPSTLPLRARIGLFGRRFSWEKVVGEGVGAKDTDGCWEAVGLFVGIGDGAADGLGDGTFVGTVVIIIRDVDIMDNEWEK